MYVQKADTKKTGKTIKSIVSYHSLWRVQADLIDMQNYSTTQWDTKIDDIKKRLTQQQLYPIVTITIVRCTAVKCTLVYLCVFKGKRCSVGFAAHNHPREGKSD
jgi:hypothetical protein